MSIRRMAIACSGVLAGIMLATASPAMASTGWTTYAADSDKGRTVLEVCAGSQAVCSMTYDAQSYQTFSGSEHPVGDSVYNYTSQTETHSLTWSDTVETSDTLEVSSSAKATIWGAAEVGVNTTYSRTWGKSSTVSETDSLPVPGCSVAWLARAAEMGTATGNIHVHFAKHTHLNGHRDFIITNAVFTAPTGAGSIIARSRSMNASESASCS
ncbi:hypothetical protein [Streptomyces pluripotens]|uniref:hypothetical protein n=1 Tax=Streptomyces pluripotens TaxID=1355015 RepID=UPI00131C8FBA|nr:hypothetical protein [Streptomyces pluripotens]